MQQLTPNLYVDTQFSIPPVGPGSLPDAAMDTSKLGGVDELLYSEPPAAYDSAEVGEGGLSNKKIIIAYL